MKLAFRGNDLRLMNHLHQQLTDPTYEAYADLLIKAYNQPEKIESFLVPTKNSKTREIASLALQRWARITSYNVCYTKLLRHHYNSTLF